MAEIFGLIPQLADLIQKAGVVGLLLLICGVLVWEIRRLRSEAVKTYRQRDRARLERERYKSACIAHSLAVDISDIAAMFEEDKEDE